MKKMAVITITMTRMTMAIMFVFTMNADNDDDSNNDDDSQMKRLLLQVAGGFLGIVMYTLFFCWSKTGGNVYYRLPNIIREL